MRLSITLAAFVYLGFATARWHRREEGHALGVRVSVRGGHRGHRGHREHGGHGGRGGHGEDDEDDEDDEIDCHLGLTGSFSPTGSGSLSFPQPTGTLPEPSSPSDSPSGSFSYPSPTGSESLPVSQPTGTLPEPSSPIYSPSGTPVSSLA